MPLDNNDEYPRRINARSANYERGFILRILQEHQENTAGKERMIEKRKEEEEKKMRKNKDKEIKGRGSKVERWRKNKNSYLSLNDVSIKYMQVFCVDICLRAVSKKGGGGGGRG